MTDDEAREISALRTEVAALREEIRLLRASQTVIHYHYQSWPAPGAAAAPQWQTVIHPGTVVNPNLTILASAAGAAACTGQLITVDIPA